MGTKFDRSISAPMMSGKEDTSIEPAGGHIGALDGWRGVAVLLVLIDHCAELSHSGLIHKVTRVGATGVGIFFALSGFLITTLLIGEYQRSETISLGKFFIRRLFRIVPPVFLYLATLLVFRHMNLLQVTNHQVTSSIFLFRNYIISDWKAGWYTGHLWSLMVEEHFYLLWPLILLLSKRKLMVPVTLALFVAAWRIVNDHLHTLRGVWPPGRTDLRMDGLLWGCALAIILSNAKWRERLKLRLTAPIMLLLVAIDMGSNVIHGQHDYSWFEPIILALLLVWPLLYQESFLRRGLDTRFLTSVGKISYSLYIWQQLWLLFPGAPTIFPRLQSFPFNVVMAVLCAVASYYLIETPFIRLGKISLKRIYST